MVLKVAYVVWMRASLASIEGEIACRICAHANFFPSSPCVIWGGGEHGIGGGAIAMSFRCLRR